MTYTITRNDRPRRQGISVTILVRNNIDFGIANTCSCIDTNNEVITVILKDSRISASIETTRIPIASLTNTTLLSNIKSFVHNIIITGSEQNDFKSTKIDKWGIALKRLYMILIYLLLRLTYLRIDTVEPTQAISVFLFVCF